MTWSDAVFMMPEIVLTIAASLLLLAPVTGFRGSEWSAKWVTLVVLAITGGSIVACSWAVPDMTASPMLNAMFALDAFAIFFKLLFVVVIALIVLLSDDFLAESRVLPYASEVASLLVSVAPRPLKDAFDQQMDNLKRLWSQPTERASAHHF